jgi:hypothetical protein
MRIGFFFFFFAPSTVIVASRVALFFLLLGEFVRVYAWRAARSRMAGVKHQRQVDVGGKQP